MTSSGPKDTGWLTDEQLAALSSSDVAALLSRNSGDKNLHWIVREAVLNRAAAEILRLSQPTEARRRELRFVDLPKGTRFRYVNSSDVFVVLSTQSEGLIAQWKGPLEPPSLQGLFSAAESPHAAQMLVVEVIGE